MLQFFIKNYSFILFSIPLRVLVANCSMQSAELHCLKIQETPSSVQLVELLILIKALSICIGIGLT